jgi:hypothetical protein
MMVMMVKTTANNLPMAIRLCASRYLSCGARHEMVCFPVHTFAHELSASKDKA